MTCVAVCYEMIRWGGNFRVESVATFAWNQWQLSRGISGNFAVEYADNPIYWYHVLLELTEGQLHKCQKPLEEIVGKARRADHLKR